MSEWLPELFAFYAVPVVVGCSFVVAAAAATRANGRRSSIAAIAAIAILVMFTVVRPLSPPTVYLGQIPRLQEWVGTVGIAAAGAVLFMRTRAGSHQRSSLWADSALGIATFFFVSVAPVAALLLMASMNPD
jgi:hypothetical protein